MNPYQEERVTVTFQPGADGLPLIRVDTSKGNRAAFFDPKMLGVSATVEAVGACVRRLVFEACGKPVVP